MKRSVPADRKSPSKLNVKVGKALGRFEPACYDKDWAITGPLIEKYKINLHWNGEHWFSDITEDADTSCWHLGPQCGFVPCADQASTPLVLVCKTLSANVCVSLNEFDTIIF